MARSSSNPALIAETLMQRLIIRTTASPYSLYGCALTATEKNTLKLLTNCLRALTIYLERIYGEALAFIDDWYCFDCRWQLAVDCH